MGFSNLFESEEFSDPLGENFSGVGGVSGGEGGTPASPKRVVWGQLHQEILEAWLVDEDEWGGPAMQALAKRLRTPVEDFAYAMGEVGEEELSVKRAERLLEAERIRNKDMNWDRLEEAVLSKLNQHVMTAKNLKVGEMLAIATTANRASRKNGSQPMNGPNINIQMNGGPGANPQVTLPGAGNLGTMTLTLAPKTIQQLGQGITVDGEVNKMDEKIEMLQADSLTMLGKLADETE